MKQAGAAMGLIRFAVYPASLVNDWPEVHAGYLTGADGRIFSTRIEIVDNIIECRRSSSESVKFHVAWPVPGYGRIVIPTASLPEREEPYLLAVELARGKIVQVRNQSSQWELAGLQIPEEFRGPNRAAHQSFSRAAASQSQPELASQLADEAIRHACEAAEILTRSYGAQALAGRLQRFGSLPVSIGCELDGDVPTPEGTVHFNNVFHSATVAIPWTTIEAVEGEYNWDATDRRVEWCEQQKLMIRGGPLIDLGPGGLPPWLALWEQDVFNLQSFVCDFVETAIARYFGRIHTWEVCTRMNTGGALTLSEESRLTLTARVFDVARQVDEDAHLIVRVDQPWGDYQSRGSHGLSPIQMVDALIRSGVGLSGVNLEVAIGYRPHGSAQRDLLECSRLIDTWTNLDIPIFVTLVCPSSSEPDELALPDIQVNPRTWPTPGNEKIQARWIESMLDLLVAKQRVAGVLLPHLSDGQSHRFPHAGLLNRDETPKEIVERLISHQINQRLKS
ncbi:MULTISPECIES: endo-1,4-beta-xylanase [unclassified Schlesneria]|uniref:endo-1,4-beta-xylanase n=1 Tax=unclassified Schlesneria TaxID=2762017 RepID=UPI002EEFBBEA